MKKKVLSVLMLLFMFALISLQITGCAQAEPNEEKFIESAAPVPDENNQQLPAPPAPDKSELQNPAAPVPTPYRPREDSKIITSNKFERKEISGLGQLEFTVNEIQLTPSAPEWAEDDLNAAAYLQIEFELLNVDIPVEDNKPQNLAINLFDLYSLDAQEPYGPGSPWFSPEFFSEAMDTDDIKEYFLLSLPMQGESRTFSLCWVMDDICLQMLRDDKFALTYSFAENELMPIKYSDITDNTM